MGGRGLGRGRLQFPDPSVHAGLADQFLVGSLLGDPARVEHQDAIRLLDGRKSVGDDQSGLFPVPTTDRGENLALGPGVHRTERVVENQAQEFVVWWPVL